MTRHLRSSHISQGYIYKLSHNILILSLWTSNIITPSLVEIFCFFKRILVSHGPIKSCKGNFSIEMKNLVFEEEKIKGPFSQMLLWILLFRACGPIIVTTYKEFFPRISLTNFWFSRNYNKFCVFLEFYFQNFGTLKKNQFRKARDFKY